MKYNLFVLFLLLTFYINANSQRKYLSLGSRHAGVCIGNSFDYNGLRINLFDKDVKRVTGFNLSANKKSRISNGLSVAFFTLDSTQNGVSVAFVSGSLDRYNGVALAYVAIGAKNKINGVGISGIQIAADTLNGFFASFLGCNRFKNKIKLLNGVSAGILFGVDCENLNGFSVGAINKVVKQKGLVIGVFNKTKELHGVQFGIWNIAENNKRFKRMPLLNFNFLK